jgi:hypothetical protein
MAKSFTGTEFIKALAEGSLREPIVKEGMVKPADNDPNAIMFSEGTSCLFWTKIPVEMIEKVEYATTIRCQDHQHPFVRLLLKDPPAENKVATLLAELLRQTVQRQSPAIGANTLRPAAPTPGARARLSAASTQDVKEFYWEVSGGTGGCSIGGAHLTLRRDGSASWRAIVSSIYHDDSYCVTLSFFNDGGRELFAWPRFCSQSLWQHDQVWTNNNLAFPERYFDSIAIVTRRDHC